VAAPAAAQQPTARWFKGNTHAHTLNSDGDVLPEEVVHWYQTHGYHFTFITDHEFITDVAPLNALVGATGKFQVFSAQEVTQRITDPVHPDGLRQAHVNALGVTRVIRPLGERNIGPPPMSAAYARNLGEIRKAGGVPQINHPNFRWSVRLDDLLDLPDSTLFEVWNGHPQVYNLGGTDSLGRAMPSAEALWDSLLTRGKVIFGVGDDDSHYFKPEDAENADMARPGRAWVMVRADTLTQDAILASLRRGDFYASTGITLRSYAASVREIQLEIAPAGDMRFRTEFIGRGGRVLASSTALRVRYTITGSEGYVRARITDSAGHRAWMQPVTVRR
jgi:hypothetical protein